MNEILSHYYRVHPATWVYLSSLLSIGVFFKFNRFWSVRNLDLILLLFLAPGLLLVDERLREPPWQTGSPTATAAPSGGRKGTTPADDQPPTPPAVDANGAGPDRDAAPGDDDAGDTGDKSIADEQDSTNPPSEDGKGAPTADKGTNVAPAKGEKPALDPDARRRKNGFIWLFCVGGVLLVRLLVDATMVRRPLLDPNLSIGGMTFIACSLFFFLSMNVVTSKPVYHDRKEGSEPGYRLLYRLPTVPTSSNVATVDDTDDDAPSAASGVAAKTLAILAQLAIVVGLAIIGYRHFDNLRTGIGVAFLYLMLPYTAMMTGRVDHALPAALLVWAVFFYRNAYIAGVLLGLASIAYYPLYLLPLWFSFYWQRGKFRFFLGVLTSLGALMLLLAVSYGASETFWEAFKAMYGLWAPKMEGLKGFWENYNEVYRIPLLAAFIALSGSFALWPAQKNLGTLMCCSAAVMLGAQFWQGNDGGLTMAWYLPLLLLTIFRPNLEDRVALAVLGEGWIPRRKQNGAAASEGPPDDG